MYTIGEKVRIKNVSMSDGMPVHCFRIGDICEIIDFCEVEIDDLPGAIDLLLSYGGVMQSVLDIDVEKI